MSIQKIKPGNQRKSSQKSKPGDQNKSNLKIKPGNQKKSSLKINPGTATDPKVSQVRVTVRDIGTFKDKYKGKDKSALQTSSYVEISIVTDIQPGLSPTPDYYTMEIFLKPPNHNWIALPWKELAGAPCSPDYSLENTQDPACQVTELITKTYSSSCEDLPLIPSVLYEDITQLKIRINDEDPYFIGGYPPSEDSNNRAIGFMATHTM